MDLGAIIGPGRPTTCVDTPVHISGWYVDLICRSTEPLIIHKQQSALIYPRRARVSLLTTQNATPRCLFHWPSGGKFLSWKEWVAHAEALVSCPSFIMSPRSQTHTTREAALSLEMCRTISTNETDQIQVFLQIRRTSGPRQRWPWGARKSLSCQTKPKG